MKKTGTMDRILIIGAVFLLVFTVIMLVLYYLTGGIPDTLCSCVYAFWGGEAGIMGWIKTTKVKQKERTEEDSPEDMGEDEQEESEVAR